MRMTFFVPMVRPFGINGIYDKNSSGIGRQEFKGIDNSPLRAVWRSRCVGQTFQAPLERLTGDLTVRDQPVFTP